MEPDAETSPAMTGHPPFAIETERRLSRSILWRLQRSYFEKAGIDAWSDGAVPHYVTNNPVLAHAYAQVFLGFLRDARATLDPGEPVTIVELGAGSGRFAYLFLRAFTELLRRSPLAGLRFRYVMTDFTETNVGFYEGHDALRPFVEQGVLDFAVFDAETDTEIRLLRAGSTISQASLANPLCVIANYVFDGISQDAFFFEGGQLHECAVSLSSATRDPDLGDPTILGRLAISYANRPAPIDYYEEADLNAILRGYAKTTESARILFPSAAIRCVGRLSALSRGGLFLLSGDRGDIDESAVRAPDAAGMAFHGSFSLNVNYHAIAEYVRSRGGVVLGPAHGATHLHVLGFVLGHSPVEHAETRFAYETFVEHAGPDDFFSLRRGIQGHYQDLELPHVLSLIRLSHHDPRILRDCLPVLWARLGEASQPLCQDVIRTVMKVWETYYFIGEALDLAFELALLAHGYGGFREALALFRASARLHGEDPKTQWNMGLCHYALGEVEAALGCFGEAATMAPGFVPSGAVQVKDALE